MGLCNRVFSVGDAGGQEGANFDSTGAFILAHQRLPSSGGMILVDGDFYIEPGEFVVSKPNVQFAGTGWGHSVINRGSDSDGILVYVTDSATSFTMRDLSILDKTGTPTNNGLSLLVESVNDAEFTRCWFQIGHELVKLNFGSNIGFSQCIFEGNRSHGLHVVQTADVRVTGCAFYRTGYSTLVNSNATAAIFVEKEASYTYRPFTFKITGNSFFYSERGHFIRLSQTAGVAIQGNGFEMAGRFDPNRWDDIKLEACEWITISGNTATAEYNDYSAGNRASRYNVNVDASCSHIVIGPNAFNPGSAARLTTSLPTLSSSATRVCFSERRLGTCLPSQTIQ